MVFPHYFIKFLLCHFRFYLTPSSRPHPRHTPLASHELNCPSLLRMHLPFMPFSVLLLFTNNSWTAGWVTHSFLPVPGPSIFLSVKTEIGEVNTVLGLQNQIFWFSGDHKLLENDQTTSQIHLREGNFLNNGTNEALLTVTEPSLAFYQGHPSSDPTTNRAPSRPTPNPSDAWRPEEFLISFPRYSRTPWHSNNFFASPTIPNYQAPTTVF